MAKITSKEQYDWAVARVEELLPMVKDNTPVNDPASIELELLSCLVSEYSEEHFEIGEPSLTDILKLRMYELGLSQKGLADLLGISPSRVNDYLTGRAEPTLQIARRICTCLNVEPQIVLGI